MDRRRPPRLNRQNATVENCDCASCRLDALFADVRDLAAQSAEFAALVVACLARLAALLEEERHAVAS